MGLLGQTDGWEGTDVGARACSLRSPRPYIGVVGRHKQRSDGPTQGRGERSEQARAPTSVLQQPSVNIRAPTRFPCTTYEALPFQLRCS